MGSTVSRQTIHGNNNINNLVRGQNNRLINTYNDNRQTIIIVDDVDDKDDGDEDEDDKDDNDDDDDIDDNKDNSNDRNNRNNHNNHNNRNNDDFFSRGPLPDEDEDDYDDYTDMASSFDNMFLKNGNYDNKTKQIKSRKSKKKSRKRKYSEMDDEIKNDMKIISITSAPKVKKRKLDVKYEQLKILKLKLSKLHKMKHVLTNLSSSHCKNHLFLQKNEINFNLSEIQAFAPIIKQHSHLPPIQDISESLSFYALTFKSIPQSQTLWHLIKEQKQLSECDIRDWMTQLLLSVQFLHNNNIVHLDISPESVMVCNNKIILGGFETMKMVKDYTTYDTNELFYGASNERILNYSWKLPPYANTRPHFNGLQLRSLDMCSIGILTHFLLTANFPTFSNNNNKDIVNTPVVGECAKDFINKLLSNEMNCNDAVNHKWINDLNSCTNLPVLNGIYYKYYQHHKQQLRLKHDVLTQQTKKYLFNVDKNESDNQIKATESQMCEISGIDKNNEKKQEKKKDKQSDKKNNMKFIDTKSKSDSGKIEKNTKGKKKRKKKEEKHSAEMREKFNADIDWFTDPKDGKKYYYWKSKNKGKWKTKGVAYQHISRNWNSKSKTNTNSKKKRTRSNHKDQGHYVEEGAFLRCQYKKCTKKCKDKKQYRNHWQSHKKEDEKNKCVKSV